MLNQHHFSYENSDIALNCGVMLRECIRHEALASFILNHPCFYDFFGYVELSTFDIASDAFASFKVCKEFLIITLSVLYWSWIPTTKSVLFTWSVKSLWATLVLNWKKLAGSYGFFLVICNFSKSVCVTKNYVKLCQWIMPSKCLYAKCEVMRRWEINYYVRDILIWCNYRRAIGLVSVVLVNKMSVTAYAVTLPTLCMWDPRAIPFYVL